MDSSALFAGLALAGTALTYLRKHAKVVHRKSLMAFVETVPKAELHLHIEGTLEPETMLAIAKRNNVKLPYKTLAEAKATRGNYESLQPFLDCYYAACSVLLHEQDFYDLAMAYFKRAHEDHVVVVEAFFDPQTHTDRGVSFETVIKGLYRATQDAQKLFKMRASLIMCFLRHKSQEDAMKTLQAALPFKHMMVGVGLDSGEAGNPPAKFTEVYAAARDAGLHAVAHAGEEGPAQYIVDALDILKVERIDHGVRCLEDAAVVARLAKEGTPLTVCPLSNYCLQVYSRYFNGSNIVKRLMDAGITVTINSDDPAYFGGYINDNYRRCVEDLGLTAKQIAQLAVNSINATFLSDEAKASYVQSIKDHRKMHGFLEHFDA